MEQIRPLILLIPVFLVLFGQSTYADHHRHSSSMKFDLIHRHSLAGAPATQAERLRELLLGDIARQGAMAQRRRRMWERRGAGELKVFSGADFGNAQYFVNFRVGSPFQRFTLVVDTGSELTWMNCRYRCGRNCTERGGRIGGRRVFVGDRSASFRPVACGTRMCKVELVDLFGLDTCPLPTTPCAYDFKYLDGSRASGFFVNETVTAILKNGKKAKIRNVLIGCSGSFQGPNFNYADGVLGLAYHRHSFTSKAIDRFGGKFSYCLVDHLAHKNVSNYLVFGDAGVQPSSFLGNVRYTKLELDSIPPFYTVNVIGISIGGTLLDIPDKVWDVNQNGGMIVDSGTSLMFLATPAYRPVMIALENGVAIHQRVSLKVPMKYCFDSREFDEASVPKLAFHFAGGARFEPNLKSYIIDAAEGVKCLGFIEAAWPGFSTIGNIMQQNHVWEYDLAGGRLGFAPSTCTWA